MYAQLLRKGGAIEMIHEDLHERRAMEVGKLGNFADHADVAEPLDSFAVLPVLIAAQHHTMHWQFRSVQGGKCQQRVIYRTHGAARRHDHRQFELHHEVEYKLLLVDGHQDSPSTLHNQPVIDQAAGHVDPPEIDFYSGPARRQVGRDWRHELVHLIE